MHKNQQKERDRKKMIKENTLIHGNAKYIVRFGEVRIGLPGQQPVKFLKKFSRRILVTSVVMQRAYARLHQVRKD